MLCRLCVIRRIKDIFGSVLYSSRRTHTCTIAVINIDKALDGTLLGSISSPSKSTQKLQFIGCRKTPDSAFTTSISWNGRHLDGETKWRPSHTEYKLVHQKAARLIAIRAGGCIKMSPLSLCLQTLSSIYPSIHHTLWSNPSLMCVCVCVCDVSSDYPR